ncbi:MAG: Ldh family oxidoreductase [Clostridia bacterium]|nr:Ldh family oxidoreductase [Clostridia bacterium]
MAKTNIVDWTTITNFVIDAFVGYGIPREDAEICADVLLESDKRGIESHGCNRFKPVYLDRIKAGIQNPVTNITVVKETETTAVLDGNHGMGQVIGYKAMSMAIEKAKRYGMGMVVVRNSCHYGIAGYYTSMATKAGCIGLTGTNARPTVAPTFGVKGAFGTNPLTLGVPTDEAFDFNFDAASSTYQNGKLEYYARIGKDAPAGALVGVDGEAYEGRADEALKAMARGEAALCTLGVPTDEPFDFNFDCATSITQNGKFEYYERIGHDVVPGTVIGEDGEPVTGDAGAALKRIRDNSAALVTVGGIGELLGGYKGYGFAMFVEFLSAALSDGYYGKQLNGVDENGEKCAPRLGHFFIAIDTDHFMGEAACRKKAGDIIREIRASRRMPGAERIWTAGEKEYEIRLARKDGVPIYDSVQAELNQLRAECGLEGKYRFPWD